MQPLKDSILFDTRRMDRADETLVAALRSAGEEAEALAPILAGRTAMDVRCACEVLLSADRTRGRQVVLIASLMKSRMLITFAMKRVESDPYYDSEDRRVAQAAYRSVHAAHEQQNHPAQNGHPKKAK